MRSMNPGRDMANTLSFFGSHNGPVTVAAYLDPDPITYELELTLYTDDGSGNGEHLFTVSWGDLCTIALAHKHP